jgi:hypothetical protein
VKCSSLLHNQVEPGVGGWRSVKVSCSFPVSPFLPDGQASADKKDAAEAKLFKMANSVRIPAFTALSRPTPLHPSNLTFFLHCFADLISV